MPETPPPNPELQLAGDLIEHTGCSLFLTGRAGTGKTTFLHNLRRNAAKRLIVTAPTGVAAINAGGVTLHSFFQLPFGPFIPGNQPGGPDQRRQFRFSKEKKRIIQSLDLLVIDEISMVRADLLDAVDAVLRRQRRSSRPFGGVQLLLIGDLHQLPPVARQEEWDLLQDYYESVYFFSSRALAQSELFTIELQHIYRQSDPAFIRILNRVRDNRLDQSTLEELNRRCDPDFEPTEEQGYITLTTHNRRAEKINASRLGGLPGKEYRFQAGISGEFPEHLYPGPADLRLKVGAQVMFIRNDPSGDRLYYNGKIGRIRKIAAGEIRVLCPGDENEIKVERLSWENIKYTVNEENREIEADTVGKFEQYPLKPAWAITIHKSQGLTFDRLVIDARAAFAHGQVYVALSRCRSLEGLVLSSPLSARALKTDETVNRFLTESGHNPPTADHLQAAITGYQQRLLLECFDFSRLSGCLNYLVRLILGNPGTVQVAGLSDLQGWRQEAAEIFTVSENFKRQLEGIFPEAGLPESDGRLLERITKASAWFQEKLALILESPLSGMRLETDNRDLDKKLDKALNNLKRETSLKLAAVKSCEQGFSPPAYLRALSGAAIDFSKERPKKQEVPDYTESDIAHPQLFRTLKDWRSRKAEELKVPPFQILHQRTLIQIVIHLPDNPADLEKIKGVGKKTVEKYGQDLVAMVSSYRWEHGIQEVVLPEPRNKGAEGSPAAPETPQTGTRETSLEMFNQGLTVSDIAGERGLALSTVEGHLSFFVEKGELEIDRLLTPEKQEAIAEKIEADRTGSLKAVKTELGDDYTYGEIKMMLAHRNAAAPEK